jgi:mono/diheme cytochrome c family protein
MRVAWTVLTTVFVGVLLSGGAAAQTRGGDPEAAKVKNPVAATQASVTAGSRAYARNCRQCHGVRARGDGPLAPNNPRPADLTDATWEFGASDGEIFALIWNGVPDDADTEMKGMKDTLAERDVWSIVNYLRSLGPKN